MFPGLGAYLPSDDFVDGLARIMREGVNDLGQDPDHPTLPAGYTYLGQFLDHDVTFDPLSNLRRPNEPSDDSVLADFRTPRLDLDSLYGSGPLDMPFLYDQDGQPRGLRLLVGDSRAAFGPNCAATDLPRNVQGRALIGDPRNDENAILTQLHLVFLQFHNRVVEQLLARRYADQRLPKEDDFSTARRLVCWHYQWLVVNDFLPRIVSPELLNALQANPGRRFLRFDGDLFMPVEFSGAAYRFGHTLIRPSYQVNDRARRVRLFADGADNGDPGHLGGFRPLLADLVIDWRRFVEFTGSRPQLARRLDIRLAEPLDRLPGGVAPPNRDGQSLAWLNLNKGRILKLPSGQAVAGELKEQVLDDRDLGLDGQPAPLWYYVLAEAAMLGRGEYLGPVGGRIVAEVILGLLDADDESYVHHRNGTWTPFLGPRRGRFTLADLISSATLPHWL